MVAMQSVENFNLPVFWLMAHLPAVRLTSAWGMAVEEETTESYGGHLAKFK